MPEMDICPSCRSQCRDPWHYEADMEEPEEDDGCCIPRSA